VSADDLLERGPNGHVTLVGGWSASSGRHHFPVAERCPYSGADDVERVLLPRIGRLWLWTSVTAAPPGYHGPVPYGFGVVALDGVDLLVVGRLSEADPDRLGEGTRVEVVAEALPGADGEDTIETWAFAVAR
jgi:uncharacterized protein